MSGEQDFRDLRRLLALKRHEQPPPGYFNNFSRNVIAGIRAEAASRRETRPGWLQRFWAALETQPIAAGAFGAAVCGLLLGGLLFSDPGDTGMTQIPQPEFAPGIQAASFNMGAGMANPEPFASITGSNAFLPSETGGSLFDQVGRGRSVPTAFSPR